MSYFKLYTVNSSRKSYESTDSSSPCKLSTSHDELALHKRSAGITQRKYYILNGRRGWINKLNVREVERLKIVYLPT